jgi:lysozyme family protein
VAEFVKAIDYVLANEGGLVENPLDPGGTTNYGIAQRWYPQVDVRSLTLQQAQEIYRQDFWRFDGFTYQSVATKALDMVVNLGLVTGVKLIQEAAGVDPDGVIGPGTLGVVNHWCPRRMMREMGVRAAARHCDLIVANPKLKYAELGWLRRDFKTPPAEVVAGDDF